MSTNRNLSVFTKLHLRLNNCVLRASFASIRHRAASRMRLAPALIVFFAATFSALASAQTAHLSQAQFVLNIPTTLDWPQAVAVDANENLYVADPYNHRVLKLTPSEGGFSQSTVGTGFNQPYGVALDASGDVYITDIFATTLFKETPNGSGGYTQSTIGSGLYDAVSVAVDSQGNLYGVEINNSFIGSLFKETLSGGSYTQTFIPVPGTHGVERVAVDGFGDLFLGDGWDNEVFEDVPLAGGGYTTTQIPGSQGPFAVDSENNLYIGGLDYISKLTPNGSGGFTTSSIPIDNNSVPTPYGYFDAPGLAVDQNGNLFFDDLYTFNLIEESMSVANAGQVPVTGTSYPVSMFFTFDTTGTMGSYSIVTNGVPNSEFTDSTLGNCVWNLDYFAGSVCNVDVSFTPTAPGTRSGAVVLNDGLGNPFATGYVQGTGVSPLVGFEGVAPASLITGLDLPQGITVDASGNVIVANSGNKNVLLTPPGGSQSPVGSGFINPTGVAEDGAGNIFVADSGNVYEIAKATGVQTNLNLSWVTNPNDLAIDGAGNLYISEPNLSKVLKVTPSGMQTSVGTGLSAPRGIAVDPGGNVYIADYAAGNVYVVTPLGEQSTISGFGGPAGVAVDAAGNVYVAVYGSGELIEVAPGGARTTLASGLSNPYSVALDGNGNLYFSQYVSGAVTKIDRADAPTLNFASTPWSETSIDSPRTLTLSNNGNATLSFPVPAAGDNPSISGDFSLNGSAPSDCPLVAAGGSQASLAPAASCLLPISFTPEGAGNLSGSLAFTDNSLNAVAPAYAVQSISLSGIGVPLPAAMSSPSPGSTLSSSTVTFSWTTGEGVTDYWFNLGTAAGGSNAKNLYSGGSTTLTSRTVSGLPTNGETIYATLYSFYGGAWQPVVYTYTASGSPTPAVLTTPSPSSTLTSATVTFSWTPGSNVQHYWFNLGTAASGVNAKNLYAGASTTATSVQVSGLPTNGETIYATLYSYIEGVWQPIAYTYTATGSPTPAVLTTPSPNSTLTSAAVTFTWSPGNNVQHYWFNLGTASSGANAKNIYSGASTTQTSVQVSGLPTNGETIYATLFSYINGAWQPTVYTYTASGSPTPAALITPTPSTTLTSTSVTFTWSAGSNVQHYWLNLGTAASGANAKNIYSGASTTATSVTVNNLPNNSEAIYATLYSYINGTWQPTVYTYTAQ